MYEAFYQLNERPFSIQPDPAYLYFGRRHRLAYTMLEYGVAHRAGFTVITGEVGCGKTTLIRHLLGKFGKDVRVGLISNTHQDINELLEWVLLSFGQPYEATKKVALFDQLQRFLVAEYRQKRRTILIIDEAQNLGSATLEELRMLSNVNVDKNQLLQMVLVGQPQLRELLCHPDLQQFAQRVAADFHIGPLTAAEVPEYICHRLWVAGRGAMLFDDGAMALIADASEGRPRKINILCDRSLVYGYSNQVEIITSELVEEVLEDMLSYGVFGPDMTGPTPEPEGVLPRTRSLVEFPEIGSESRFDSSAARSLFANSRSKD